MNQGFAAGPRQESSYDIGVGDVGQLVALLGEAPDVPMKSFPRLLSVVFEIPWVPSVKKMDPRPIYFGFWCLMTNTTKLD